MSTSIEILREANKKNEKLLEEYNASKAERVSAEDVLKLLEDINIFVDLYNQNGTKYEKVAEDAKECQTELEKLRALSNDNDSKLKDRIMELEKEMKINLDLLNETNLIAAQNQQQASQCLEELKHESEISQQQLAAIAQIIPKRNRDESRSPNSRPKQSRTPSVKLEPLDTSNPPSVEYATPRTSRRPSVKSDLPTASHPSNVETVSPVLPEKPAYLNNYNVKNVATWGNVTADKYIAEIAKNPNANPLKPKANLNEKRDYIMHEMARLAWK